MTFWRRRNRLRYRWLGLAPFGLFLERPLPLWQQILNRPAGWTIVALRLNDALREGQAR